MRYITSQLTAVIRLCVCWASLVCIALLVFNPSVYAQGNGEPVLLVNEVAPGGQLRFKGYAFPVGQSCTLQLLSDNTPLEIGSLQSDRVGTVAPTTFALPTQVAPGNYPVQCMAAAGVPPLARTEVTVRAAPTIILDPPSGPPGTVVSVTVDKLVAGSLRVDYAGAAVIGPLVVGGSSYEGAFVVPNDRPAPLGANAPVVATNLVGDLVVGVGQARFQSQEGTSRPRYAITELAISEETLSPGSTFLFSGRITPPPNGPLEEFQVGPFWLDDQGQRFPIGNGIASLQADGTFQVQAQAPTLLKGAPAFARDEDSFGLTLTTPDGQSYQSSLVRADVVSLWNKFRVYVLKDKPGEADDGQPIPNLPQPGPGEIDPLQVWIEPIITISMTQSQLDSSITLTDGKMVLDITAVQSAVKFEQISEKMDQLSKMAGVKCIGVHEAVIPWYEWIMTPEETILVSTLNAPVAQQIIFNEVAINGSAQSSGSSQVAADDEELMVQLFRVGVDAFNVVDGNQHGYGFVDEDHLFHPTERLFVYVPSQERAFAVEGEGATAVEVSHPVEVRLPPLPADATSGLQIESVEIDGVIQPTKFPKAAYGNLYSFRKGGQLESGINYAEVKPIRVSVRLYWPGFEASLTPNVNISFNGQDFPIKKGADEKGENYGCHSGPHEDAPASAYDYYYIEVPNAHQLPPGDYAVEIEVDDGGNSQDQRNFALHFVDYAPFAAWFANPALAERTVVWSAGGLELSAHPYTPENSSTNIGANVEYVGDKDSNVRMDGSVTTRLSRHGNEYTMSQGGTMKSNALNNESQALGYGGNSGVATTSGLQLTLDEIEPVTVLDTGWIRVAQFGYGIPEVLFVGITMDFRVSATALINTTLTSGIHVTLDSGVGVDIALEVDVLAGLGSAEVGFASTIGVQIPLQLSLDGPPVDVSKCFYYGLDMHYSVEVLWGAVEVADGSETLIHGDTPGGCYQEWNATLAQATQQPPQAPFANPTLATDGLGQTVAVWRTAERNIVASFYDGSTWQQPQPLTTNGKSGDPAAAFFAPDRAMVVWSQSGLDTAPAPTTKLKDIFKSQHLAYSVWDGAAWSPPQNLTLPTTGDGKVALAGCPATQMGCPAGGAVTALWVHDNVGDIAQRQFRLHTARYYDSAWSPIQVIDGTASDTEPVVAYQGGNALAFWVRDDDGDPNSLDDRHLALAYLMDGVLSAVQLPTEIPAGVVKPHVAVDQTGAVQLAFTVANAADGFLSNRRALHRAVGTCSPQAGCSWNVQQQKDAQGRSIFAESPIVTVDNDNHVTLTYRAMGFDPIAAPNAAVVDSQEPIGVFAGTGELAQLELPPTLSPISGMPHYLTGDGAVNWRPASIFEPSLNSTLVLAVKGEAVPSSHRAHLLAAQAAESARTAPDQPLVFVEAARLPNFALGTSKAAILETETMTPTKVTVQVHNTGVDWTSNDGAPLRIVAVWDGEVGSGTPAGETTLVALKSGEAQEMTFTLTIPPGGFDATHTLLIAANPGQSIAEQSAEDNRLYLSTNGLPRPKQVRAIAEAGKRAVLLHWQAEADPRVVGYRIYHIDDAGRQVPIGSTFSEAWIDTNVTWDQPARYVVTSFSHDLVESVPSLMVEATLHRAIVDNPPPGPLQPSLYLPMIIERPNNE